jgi:hypothetical protein
MQIIKRLFITLGSVALLSVVLTLSAPKAVHAVVAALVQVTNTTANPVPVMDVLASGEQTVELACTFSPGNCVQINTDGSYINTPWAVPAGMHYVITSVEITTLGAGGPVTIVSTNFLLYWTPPGGSLREEAWQVINNGATTQYQFPSGIVVSSGSAITCQSAGAVNFGYVRGYLAPN